MTDTTTVSQTIITTKQQIAAALAEWNKQVMETPEEFASEDVGTEAYDAEAGAEFFIKLLHQVVQA